MEEMIENTESEPKVIKQGYVIISHHYKKEGFGSKIKVHETCEFESSLKNRHIRQAYVILDYKNMKIVKQRGEMTFEEIEAYLKKSYGEKFDRFLKIIGRL